MLVPKFNAVKVESVPLKFDEFRQSAASGHYAALLDGKEQAAHVLVSFLERALARRGGEPGVVVAHRTRQTESG
jgi:hypothetical protein